MSPSGHPSCKPSPCSNGNSHSNRAMPGLSQVISCFSMKLPCIGDYIFGPPHFSNDETLSRTGFAGEKGVKSHRSHKNSKCKYQVICSIIYVLYKTCIMGAIFQEQWMSTFSCFLCNVSQVSYFWFTLAIKLLTLKLNDWVMLKSSC